MGKELDDLLRRAAQWLAQGGPLSSPAARSESIAIDAPGVSHEDAKTDTALEAKGEEPAGTLRMDTAFDYITNIQHAAAEEPKSAKGVISIALTDIKVLHGLVNVVVTQGIIPGLSEGVGVPLSLRSKRKIPEPKRDPELNRGTLQRAVRGLYDVLVQRDDVAYLVVTGPFHADILCGSIQLANGPLASTTVKTEPGKMSDRQVFEAFEAMFRSYDLFETYTALLRPGAPRWFVETVTRQLAMIPLRRRDGLQALIEFVAGLHDAGGEVSLKQLEMAVRVLKTVPKGMQVEEVSTTLGRQFAHLLASGDDSMTTAATHIVCELSTQKPAIVKGLQTLLTHSLNPADDAIALAGDESESVIVTEKELSIALAALSALVKSASAGEFLRRIADDIVVPLWILTNYLKATRRPAQQVIDLLAHLVVQVAQATANAETNASTRTAKLLDMVVRSLLMESDGVCGGNQWIFRGAADGGVELRRTKEMPSKNPLHVFQLLTDRVETLNDLLTAVANQKDAGGAGSNSLGELFVVVLRRWIQRSSRETDSPESLLDPFGALVDVRLLEQMAEKHKTHLLRDPRQIIEIVVSIVSNYALASEDGRSVSPAKLESGADPAAEAISSLLEAGATPARSTRASQNGARRPRSESDLANITAPRPMLDTEVDSDDDDDVLAGGDSDDEDPEDDTVEVIKLCLSLITGLLVDELENPEDLKLLLTVESHVKWIADKGPATLQSQARRTLKSLQTPHDVLGATFEGSSSSQQVYNKAVEALDDPIVPIKAHAMHVIRGLVLAKDPVVTLEAGLKIYLSQLSDPDSFIYLNSIKGLEALAESFSYRKVMPAVLGYYADSQKLVDERLRAGEALLRFIERNDQALDNDSTRELAETLVTMISQRKKTTEDTRLRMSAMSLLASLCEHNPRGLGPYLRDAVDVAVGVLTFESGEDMAVMRRSAVVLLAGLAQSLPSLNEFPSDFVQIVMNRLRTVSGTDSDPLARSQAGTALATIQSRLTGS